MARHVHHASDSQSRDASELSSAFKRASTTGGPDPSVRREIYSSWQRCVLAGLRRDKFEVPYLPDVDEAGPLAWAASPVIGQAAGELDGCRAGLLLTDACGHVVARKVPGREVAERLDRIDLAPGFLYSEEQIGTNAIGTAIAQCGPSVVTAEEHFAGALGRMACAAAPVTGAAGELAGVVDLTCAAEDFHPLMAPMVKRIALEVSQRLRQGHSRAVPTGWASLTSSERALAELIAQGLSRRAAADLLMLPLDAVNRHIRQIFRKLGIRTRLELARAAEAAVAQARTIEAVDSIRQQIERDLHDGIQQQLIALGLQIRAAELMVSPGQSELKDELAQIATGLLDVFANVREIARGIQPAILSQRGLEPAMKALARHSPVPVRVAIRLPGRLPERAELGAYYIAAEALANVAKHARATSAEVSVEENDGFIVLAVRDDGIGGADPGGAGLTGLRGRAAALGGQLEISSPRAGGTCVRARFPAGQLSGIHLR
jgi:signal transduction histidine kinase